MTLLIRLQKHQNELLNARYRVLSCATGFFSCVTFKQNPKATNGSASSYVRCVPIQENRPFKARPKTSFSGKLVTITTLTSFINFYTDNILLITATLYW